MADLVEDLFDGALKREFPDATRLDLYGASIVIHADGGLTLRCAGKEKHIPPTDAAASAATR